MGPSIAYQIFTRGAVIGTLFLVQISTSNIFSEANFTLTFWCFSLALNVLATLLIVSRLFVYRFRLTKVLGSSHGAQYTSVIAMVVESELLYTAFLILYIVPFILSNPLENVFVQGPALVQVRRSIIMSRAYYTDKYASVLGCISLDDRISCRTRQGVDRGHIRTDIDKDADQYTAGQQHVYASRGSIRDCYHR